MAAPGYFKFEAGIRHVTIHVVHVGKLSLTFTPWDWPRVDSFFEHATHLKCRVAFNAWNTDAAKIIGSPKIRPSQKSHFL